MTTAIVVDDEANLRQYLVQLLHAVWPELHVVGSAGDGNEAVALAGALKPDIAFLDIRMPGLSGLEVAQRLSANIQVVFVTAYDQYAVDAFEKAAIDYVVKPVTKARLQKTVQRLQNQNSRHEPRRLEELIRQLRPQQSELLQWLRTGQSDKTRLIAVSEALYFSADNKYTTVVTAQEEHLIRLSISELEVQLDQNQFWRIHRGIIVNVHAIEDASRDIRGRYTLTLRGRPEKLRSSRRYGHLFKLS